MRSVNDYLSDLEADRGERERELRVLLSFLPEDRNSDDGKPVRRSLVLVIYAHLEGFARFALTTYLEAINAYSLEFKDASVPIAAAAATDVFDALSNTQKKSDVFRNALPDDTALHRFARQQEFVQEYENRIGTKVIRLADRALNFDSNMKAAVLKRNLFVLGIEHGFVDGYSGAIDSLLHIRNAVAHGDRISNPLAEFVEDRLASALAIMEAIQGAVHNALVQQAYRRVAA